MATARGSEGSAGSHENEFNRWLNAMRPRGITAHVILIKNRGNGLTEIIASAVAENSGGRYEVVNTPNSIPDKMKGIAAELGDDYTVAKTRYQVEFATDAADSLPVDVGVARDGVSLKIMQTRVR